jgi:hypothetical protein
MSTSVPMYRSREATQRLIDDIKANTAASLERTKRRVAEIQALNGTIPPDVAQFLAEQAAEPQPHTARTFLRAIYDKLPNKWRVGYAIAALFQLYLAHRAVMLSAMANPPMLCSDIPRTTLYDSFLQGSLPGAQQDTPEEVDRYQNCVDAYDDPAGCVMQAPVDANRSVVDAVFAKEARKRQPKSN